MHQLESTDFEHQITEVQWVPWEPTISGAAVSQVPWIWVRFKDTVSAVIDRGGSNEVIAINSLQSSVENLAMKMREIPSPWSDSNERNTVVVRGNTIVFKDAWRIVGRYSREEWEKKWRVLYDLYDIHEKWKKNEHALFAQQTKTEIIDALCKMLHIPSILTDRGSKDSSSAMPSTQFTTRWDTANSDGFHYGNRDSPRVTYVWTMLPWVLDHVIFEDVRTIFRAQTPDPIREAEKIRRSSEFKAIFDQLPGQESGLQIVDIAVILESLLGVISNAQIQPELLVETIERYILIRYLFPDETCHASEKYFKRDIIDIDDDIKRSLQSVSTTLSQNQQDIEAQIQIYAQSNDGWVSENWEPLIDLRELREDLQRRRADLEFIALVHSINMITMLVQLKTTEYALRQSIVRERQFRESLWPDDLHHSALLANNQFRLSLRVS